MDVYCYADDIGIWSPTLSGLKKCGNYVKIMH